MTMKPKHLFKSYIMDPVPAKLWRNGSPIPGTKLGFCEACGFYHADPYPSESYLKDYYSSYEMPTPQANLPETARLLARHAPLTARIVDIGCGDGSFLKEMHNLGYRKLTGFDQGPGIERARTLGFADFRYKSVWDYLGEAEAGNAREPSVVVMINVLEHVSTPLDLLRRVHSILPKDGLLCVTVPNDFSPLQQAFLKVKGHLPWFVCLPDHLNYFSFSTLSHALRKSGFKIVDQTALYPLELFLLQDLDYVANPELGPVAHQRRVMFEQNMKAAGMTETLDHFYRTLAAGGYGRDIMVISGKS